MTEETPATTTNDAPAWFIDEGIPGVGERPAWLPEKYKTAADMAKHTSELEKRLGTVPDEYDFSQSRYLDGDYEPFQELRQLARDKRVPKDVMDKVIDSVDKYMDEFKHDGQEEIKKLGPNAKERITTLENWAKANLSKDSFEALTGNLRTAEAIQALEELRGKMMSTTPQVPGNDGNIANGSSLEDLRIELQNNLAKYKSDPTYQKDLSARIQAAAKNTPGYVDKVGA